MPRPDLNATEWVKQPSGLEIWDVKEGTGEPVKFDPAVQVAALQKAIDDAPKSTKWKLRARVGERVTWYAEPEEMEHRSL